MTLERAHEVSTFLASEGLSHSIVVGVHEGMMPRLACRVELHTMQRDKTFRQVLAIIDEFGGLDLAFSSLARDAVYVVEVEA